MIEEQTLSPERDQLTRILASSGFQSSRLTREFLKYAAERALAGAQVDQAQIAKEVLGRRDFDPTTDASVRKLATQVRQRLERYYEEEGAADEVIVALPLRSYTPTFAPRPAPVPARSRWPWIAGVSLASIAAATFALWYLWPVQREDRLVIWTQRGDILQPKPDPAPGALRFGPPVAEDGEVFTRLTFRPDHEGQHAGIAAWEAGDRWISVGRRFTFRNVITFGYEDRGGFRVVQEVGDLEGQSGSPVWLRLTRRGDAWSASWSHTGTEWAELGSIPSLRLSAPKSALFALNGRRESPSIPAEFQFAGAGSLAPELTPCDPAGVPRCTASWTRFAPTGDFSVTTRMDMPTDPGHSGGLFVRGESGRVRLVRYFSEGPRIALIRDGKLLESEPDYAGSPPVYLRFDIKAGKLIARCSVDGITFRQVGNPVELALLGRAREYGLVYSPRVGAGSGPPAAAPRFFFIQQGF